MMPEAILLPLSYEVNQLPNFFISDSCSGHVYENPDDPSECIIKPNGYVTMHCSSAEEADSLTEQLRNLCVEWNARQDVFRFNFLRLSYGFTHFDIRWAWKGELAQEYYSLRRKRSGDGRDLKRMYAISGDFRDRDCMKIVQVFLEDLRKIFEGNYMPMLRG